jgi:FRG domain
MFPLESIYGAYAYRTFRAFERNGVLDGKLTRTRQTPKQVREDEPLTAKSYAELVDVVSFLSVMNKRHTLYFRGQSQDWPLRPAIFRSSWTSLSRSSHSIPNNTTVLSKMWDYLESGISNIVLSVCAKLPMPRRATLTMFREAVWAIAQHYDVWPTPLIDVSPSLRIAASFALWGGRKNGHLYVVALPPSTDSITFDADQHIVLARLQAVCPPVAKRPHYQDGFLAGRFPFMSPVSNKIDKRPANVSDLAHRLVARIDLTDAGDAGGGFWSDDFPRMSELSLMPKEGDDRLLGCLAKHASQIDEAMNSICTT